MAFQDRCPERPATTTALSPAVPVSIPLLTPRGALPQPFVRAGMAVTLSPRRGEVHAPPRYLHGEIPGEESGRASHRIISSTAPTRGGVGVPGERRTGIPAGAKTGTPAGRAVLAPIITGTTGCPGEKWSRDWFTLRSRPPSGHQLP